MSDDEGHYGGAHPPAQHQQSANGPHNPGGPKSLTTGTLPNGGLPAMHGMDKELMIWSGTTWPKACLSPLCCSSVKWKVTSRRIDYEHGCCGSTLDTLDIRRILDLKFHRSCMQFMCCRGTVTILSADETDPAIHITTFGAKKIYENLREAWLASRNNVAVDMQQY